LLSHHRHREQLVRSFFFVAIEFLLVSDQRRYHRRLRRPQGRVV
jgi:hypothetical protein